MATPHLLPNPELSNNLKRESATSLLSQSDPPLPNHMQVSQNDSPLRVSSYELQNEVIAALWSALSSIYGKKFTDQFGEFCDENGVVTSTVRIWSQALSGIAPLRLERGLRTCLERDSPWPPTLPEFIHLCAKKPWE